MRRPLVAVVLVLIACSPEATLLPAGPNHPPTATFVVPALGREGSQVLLTAEDASDADGDPLTFAWRFGDGDSVMTRDPIVGHIYRNNGSYRATLIVSDSLGAADTSNANTTIANVAPEVTVLSFPDTVVAGTTVRIEIRYSDPGLDDTVRASIWVWQPGSGGGTGLPGPGFVELFFAPGEYGIEVIAEDNDGAVTVRQGDHPLTVVPASSPSRPRPLGS